MNFKTISLGKLSLVNPCIMGILNVSAHSFCEQNRAFDPDQALDIAMTMVEEGAAIIDVGAEPTNPAMNEIVSFEQESELLFPVLERLQKYLTVPFSVDTSHPKIMALAASYGMAMINDVRALSKPGALSMAAKLQLPVCLMYMRSLQSLNGMKTMNMMDETKNYLQSRIHACEQAGIARNHIILDPGFGGGSFGKNTEENLQLLDQLAELKEFNLPILIGVSRKQFIGDIIKKPVEDRLSGSMAAAVIAVMKGANIIRTHDVQATKEAIDVAAAVCNEEKQNG